MLSVSRLLLDQVQTQDVLRYGESVKGMPAHMLHFAKVKKPVVVWNVTRRCNLHCAHCYSSSKDIEYPGELSNQEGRELLEQLAEFGVPTVLFSGGEPLVRPGVIELMAYAADLGMRTVLSTNGTKLTEDFAAELAEVGVSYIGVSIDGIGALHDKLRGKKGAFAAALTGIKNAQSAGIRTGMRFTVHRLNREQLPDVFQLAKEHRVDRLCIYHLAYAGRGEKLSKYDLLPDETRSMVNEIFKLTEELQREGRKLEVLTVDNPIDNVALLMHVMKTKPEKAEDIKQLLRWNGGNQSGIAVASIDPNGNVHPDQFSWDVTAGNVREQTFSEIWSDDNEQLKPYRRWPRLIGGRCKECCHYALCNGGLRARALSATDDFSAPDPSCYLTAEEIAG